MKNFISLVLLSFCFQYSSFSQEWEEVSSPQFLSHHSFGFALDGMGYLVTGASGVNQIARENFYQYNPETDTWTELEDFAEPRAFGIGDVHDGKAYFGFGVGSFFYENDLWVFDPETGDWEELASCPCEERIHPAFSAVNGKIYMGLGFGLDTNLGDWWEYDIASDSWEEKATFPGDDRHHPFQFSLGDYVYVGLGHGDDIYNDLYRYDPSTDTWTEVSSLPGEARVAGTQFSHGGKGFVLSGEGDDHGPMETGEFWQYDPETDSWEIMPEHPGTSRWAPSSFVLNNEVYLINGMVRNFALSDFEYQSTAYKYTFDESLSISEPEKSTVKVFPNPTSDNITVQFQNAEDSKVTLTNALGISVIDKIDFNSGENEFILDLTNLASGIYYLNIGSSTQKIQKI